MNASKNTLLAAIAGTAVVTTGAASAATVISFDGIPTLDTVTTQVPGLTISASSPYANSPEEVFSLGLQRLPGVRLRRPAGSLRQRQRDRP